MHLLAARLRIPHAAAYGHVVMTWGGVAEHRVNGDIKNVPDAALERWAQWYGRPGRFAAVFRELFVGSTGAITGWVERQGKLIERAAAERARKLRGSSAENPPLRYGTVRNGTKDKKKHSRAGARATWLSQFAATWTARYDGAPAFGVLAKHLSPLVDANGIPMVLEHWTRYLAATEAQYASPARFAQTFGAWGVAGLPSAGISQHEAIRRAQGAGLRIVPTVPAAGFPTEAAFAHWLARAKETAA